ncbi:hypothetical protein AV530_011077 [Patagioenas fasciata monilis]|uniref:Uncharacterized protein n=1 Tax=Patagioenas fasciata monilis TaxID=372326 RepID=A0A1V4KZS4_PATFA|nr:hypothetical protein AV530_011077 [Patagioenas fasciata monilis]
MTMVSSQSPRSALLREVHLPSLFVLPTAAPPSQRLPKKAGASLNDGMCPWCHINSHLPHDINERRIPPELSSEEVCAAAASEPMTKRSSVVLHWTE